MKTSAPIQNLSTFSDHNIHVDVLRIDTIHPVVSGNKWFKLKHYLKQCKDASCSTIASFGGPYSNHIVALAFAAKEIGLQSIGYIRTNENEPMTATLKEAKSYGMTLVFWGRTQFQERKNSLLLEQNHSVYFVDEGGYGTYGMLGAADIMYDHPLTYNYEYIIAAVGTGTMLSGIVYAANKMQEVIGIPVLKNEGSIVSEINCLLPDDKQNAFSLVHDYHFGGYAKKNEQLLEFMKSLYREEKLPTDFVYTGKLFFAVKDMIAKQYFKKNSKVLIIHSGGLQGNRSLYTSEHSNTHSNDFFNFDLTSS